jgi:Domain of unknown function (DUF4375)
VISAVESFEGVPFPLARIDVGHILGKEPYERTIWVEREYLEFENHEPGTWDVCFRQTSRFKHNKGYGLMAFGADDFQWEVDAMPTKNHILIGLSESDKTQFGKGAFAQQSTPQKVFSSIWALESEVNNGGFTQYFLNYSCETTSFVSEALETIGAPKTA